MDTTLYYNDLLGLYLSIDLIWIFDPNSQQLYQQVSPGQYQAVQSQQPDPYAPQYPYPQIPQYPQSPQYPQAPPSYPQAPPPPVYVQPPRVGIVTVGQSSPASTQPQAPVTRPAPVVAPRAPAPTQPSGQVQTAPAPRPGAPLAQPRPATGGTVRMNTEPDPAKGYWEAFNLIGYWSEFGDSKYFFQGPYPVNKVRLTDGRLWPYGQLAIYQGRDSRTGVYFLLYDSANESYEPPWKTAGDRVRAVQVRPVLPF